MATNSSPDLTCPECGTKGDYRCSDRHRGYYTCETHGKYTAHYY